MRLTIVTPGPFKTGQRIEAKYQKIAHTPVSLFGPIVGLAEGELKVRIGGTEVGFRLVRDADQDMKDTYIGYTQ